MWRVFASEWSSLSTSSSPRVPEPDTGDARDGSERIEAVRSFLGGVHRVRVGLQGGRGFGHASATLAMVRELRDLGFAGPVELVHPRHMAERLVQLIPGFDPGRERQLLTDSGELYCIDEATFRSAPSRDADFGLIAGLDDRSSWLDHLRVDACLVLQPWGWPAERCLETRRHGRRVLPFPSGSSFVYELETPRAASFGNAERLALRAFVERGLANQPPDVRSKASALSRMLEAVSLGSLDMMPIYGLHHPAVEGEASTILNQLIGGIATFEYARGENAKPAVLLCFNELHPSPKLERHDVVQTHLVSKDACAAIGSLRPREIALVHAGLLPRTLFEALIERATLPVVLEGANTANLVHLLGKPFLSVFSGTTDLPLGDDASVSEGRRRVEWLSKGLRFDEVEIARRPAAASGRRIGILSRDAHAIATLRRTLFPNLTSTGASSTVDGASPSKLVAGAWDVAVLDFTAPDEAAFELLADLLRQSPATETLILVRPDDPRTMVYALKAGASDCSNAPLSSPLLAAAVEQLLEQRAARQQHREARPLRGDDAAWVREVRNHEHTRLARFFQEVQTPDSEVSAYFARIRSLARHISRRQLVLGLEALKLALAQR